MAKKAQKPTDEELLEQINERILEAKEKFAKVKINELLVAYAEYQGNVEEQQENGFEGSFLRGCPRKHLRHE